MAPSIKPFPGAITRVRPKCGTHWDPSHSVPIGSGVRYCGGKQKAGDPQQAARMATACLEIPVEHLHVTCPCGYQWLEGVAS